MPPGSAYSNTPNDQTPEASRVLEKVMHKGDALEMTFEDARSLLCVPYPLPGGSLSPQEGFPPEI